MFVRVVLICNYFASFSFFLLLKSFFLKRLKLYSICFLWKQNIYISRVERQTQHTYLRLSTSVICVILGGYIRRHSMNRKYQTNIWHKKTYFGVKYKNHIHRQDTTTIDNKLRKTQLMPSSRPHKKNIDAKQLSRWM